MHINVGAGNLQIRGGGQIAPCDIDGIHYDQCTVATQEILDASGNVVATQPAGVALFHPEHNHWHQSAVAEFAVRAPSTAPPFAPGSRSRSASSTSSSPAPRGRRRRRSRARTSSATATSRASPSGWADSYHQSTPLQELDVTGLKAGDYYLTHLADPDDHWLESNEANNFTWVKFRLSRQGANPEIAILSHSACVPEVICGFGGNP